MSATTAERPTPAETRAHEQQLRRAREREEPTRTRTLRKRYAQRLRGVLSDIRAATRTAIVDQDIFGLTTEALAEPPGGSYDFDRDQRKIDAFGSWLDRQLQRDLLDRFGEGENPFIKRAYEKGIRDAQGELNALDMTEGRIGATALRLPVHQRQLERLYARNLNELQGLTDELGREIRRGLSEGLAAGESPRDIADRLTDALGKVENGTPLSAHNRATMIARTEIMNSHNDARLTEWERAGVQQVGVLIANTACPQCQAYKAGEPYPASNARANLPQHPNCRCSHHVWTEADAE